MPNTLFMYFISLTAWLQLIFFLVLFVFFNFCKFIDYLFIFAKCPKFLFDIQYAASFFFLVDSTFSSFFPLLCSAVFQREEAKRKRNERIFSLCCNTHFFFPWSFASFRLFWKIIFCWWRNLLLGGAGGGSDDDDDANWWNKRRTVVDCWKTGEKGW